MSFVTIADIIENNGKISDVEYKDLAIPVGLIVEHNTNEINNFEEEFNNNCIEDELFLKLLKNEKRKNIKKKSSKKNKPIKLNLTLKRKP
jgi:hypothetical protein